VKDKVAAHVIIVHHTTKTGDEFAGDDFLVADTTGLYYVRRPNKNAPKINLVCGRVKGMNKPPVIQLSFRIVNVGQETTVVIDSGSTVDERLLSIAGTLPDRMSLEELREELEPHITGESDDARRKSFQRQRTKLTDAGLLTQEGNQYVRLT
jgi:hypothetical protein